MQAQDNYRAAQKTAEDDKIERERKERLKQYPKPKEMSEKDDVGDYLEAFEANLRLREIPQETWGDHLYPLLNYNCRMAVQALPFEQRSDYAVVKPLLNKNCQHTVLYPGKQLLDGGKQAGESLRTTAIRLTKVATKYAPEKDADVVRRKMVMEIILRGLPEATANFVREKEITDLQEAMDNGCC